MNLDISPKALEDLQGILSWIAHNRPHAAVRFVDKLDERCRMLAKFPHLGAAREDLKPLLRLSSYRGYGIYYRVLADTVRIERVLRPGLDVQEELFP